MMVLDKMIKVNMEGETTNEDTVDGLTFEMVKFNIVSFSWELRRFTHKRDVARLPHTKLKWQLKVDEYSRYLENNKRRMEIFQQRDIR